MENKIEQLAKLFEHFPGIGGRQSRRFVYFLLHSNKAYTQELTKHIRELSESIKLCKSCFKFFESNDTNEKICKRCSAPNIDKSILLVAEKDADLEAIERSRTYKGMFFVLGSLVPIAEKSVIQTIRKDELITTIKNRITDGSALKEIILAFTANPNGENTDLYLRGIIEKEFEFEVLANKLKITTLGRGLSTGTELEYSDSDTIKNALTGRH